MLQKGRSGHKIKLLTSKYVVLNVVFSYIKCSASHHTEYYHCSEWEGMLDILNNVFKILSHNTSIGRRRSEVGMVEGVFGIALSM